MSYFTRETSYKRQLRKERNGRRGETKFPLMLLMRGFLVRLTTTAVPIPQASLLHPKVYFIYVYILFPVIA